MNSLVALPIAAAVPTTAPAMPLNADPIFAAVDEFRRADAACEAVDDGNIPDELADRLHVATKAVMPTRPTTPAGLAALTTWAREKADEMEPNSYMLGEDLCALTASIDDATRGMSGLEPWSPPAPVVASPHPDAECSRRSSATMQPSLSTSATSVCGIRSNCSSLLRAAGNRKNALTCGR
jgi:hypothetical protein